MGGDKLDTSLVTFTPSTLHGSLTAVHHGQFILTISCMLPPIVPAFRVIDDV